MENVFHHYIPSIQMEFWKLVHSQATIGSKKSERPVETLPLLSQYAPHQRE